MAFRSYRALANADTPSPALDRMAGARGYLLDLDGCLVLGDRPGGGRARALPGAVELVRELKARGARLLCCTNASGRPPEAYAAGLRDQGLAIEDAEVITPPVAAAEHFARHRPRARVMVVGGAGVSGPLERGGLVTVDAAPGTEADVVLVGAGSALSPDQLQAAAEALWRGAEFLVTSYVPVIAGRRGRIASFSAAVAAGLARVTGVSPSVAGKPSQLVLETARERLGVPTGDVVVIGDDPALDVALGRRAGVPTVLVLSGVASADSVASLPESQRPDVVVDDVGELLALLRAAWRG
jgi:NagD protein